MYCTWQFIIIWWLKMPSAQETSRQHEKFFFKRKKEKRKKFTVGHFKAKWVPQSTGHFILNRKTLKRKKGTWPKATSMTLTRKTTKKWQFDNKSCVYQSKVVKNRNSSQAHVFKTSKTLVVKCRKEIRSPGYSPEKITLMKQNCQWMEKNYGKKMRILDDEKYFTPSEVHMPGSRKKHINISTLNFP